jgi:hypothetical protein
MADEIEKKIRAILMPPPVAVVPDAEPDEKAAKEAS